MELYHPSKHNLIVKVIFRHSLTVNKQGLIVHKSRHAKGSTHDYALYKHSHPKLPKEVTSKLDLGYLSIEADYPLLNCVLPFKKKTPGRGKVGVKAEPLTVTQKVCI